jgi:hypothetical protein
MSSLLFTVILNMERTSFSIMPLFDYKCPRGHIRTLTQRSDAILCGSDCSEIATRRFSFFIARSVAEHFNLSTGTYVTNEHALREDLKRQSDSESERTGLDHHYEYLSPADMADAAARGVTEEGLRPSKLRQVESLL